MWQGDKFHLTFRWVAGGGHFGATWIGDDHFAIERFDARENYGEERINLIGMCDGVLLHVTYTERGERIRLISARKAQKHERNDYYRQNAQGWDGGSGIT
ncbi:MAG: BrnT family toxin [Nostoc sp.]|uniref:BrnT family toxin n=1 Tax=Nostoc sp. TaxID=1180 RepID=UPI002FF1D350